MFVSYENESRIKQRMSSETQIVNGPIYVYLDLRYSAKKPLTAFKSRLKLLLGRKRILIITSWILNPNKNIKLLKRSINSF